MRASVVQRSLPPQQRRAVVAHEDDDRVVRDATLLSELHDEPEAVVEITQLG